MLEDIDITYASRGPILLETPRNPDNKKGAKPGDIVGLLQESKRPLPRKLRNKSEKGFLGPLGPGVEKAQKKSKKS